MHKQRSVIGFTAQHKLKQNRGKKKTCNEFGGEDHHFLGWNLVLMCLTVPEDV